MSFRKQSKATQRIAPRRSRSRSFSFFVFFFLYFCSLGFGQGLWVSLRIQLYLSDNAGPVKLKRATLGSEDWPRVGGEPGLGARGQKNNRQGWWGPRLLGARSDHDLICLQNIRGCLYWIRSVLYTTIQYGQLSFMNKNTFIHVLQNFGRLWENFRLHQLSGWIVFYQVYENTCISLNNISIKNADFILLSVLWSIYSLRGVKKLSRWWKLILYYLLLS
jgi:hypothetical protein